MPDERPNPDELLRRVQEQEAKQKRGKLKIFFGAAPGVGKTYGMLLAAREKAKEGADLVVGYLQPHVRPDTQALILGLEVLPRREVERRGAKLLEFDLQAALVRHPRIIVVDELAHTNVPSAGQVCHDKRWRDVEDLLDAGIDVYTTLNVQHLESLKDIVARITGVQVRETVPDTVFESADEIELIDLPPDDLLERLKEGKVYLPTQARLATEHFFRKGNLIALRELALRRTAERVNLQMQDWREEYAVAGTWPTAERLIVCVGPSPSSADLIRATARIARRLDAIWIAVHLETARDARMSAADRDRLTQHMNLAEQLGGEAAVLPAADRVDEVLRYAHERNVNRIIVGKPTQPIWQELLNRPFVYELTRRCGDIDVYVISGDQEPGPSVRRARRRPSASRPRDYVSAAVVVAVCTAICWGLWSYLGPHNLVNLTMVYLLGVVAVSTRLGRGPSTLAAVLSVATFDFCFVPPYFTFAVSDVQYLLTFAVMLLTGLVISNLTGRLNFQVEMARIRARRLTALFTLSRELAALRTREDIVNAAGRQIADATDADVLVLLPDSRGRFETLQLAPGSTGGATQGAPLLNEHERGVAEWVLKHGQCAGLGTDTLAGSDSLYLPLPSPTDTVGVLKLRPRGGSKLFRTDQLDLLQAMSGLVALALERVHWAGAAERARLEIDGERMRNSLLSAVSHDLRTPLAAIQGASSTLVEMGESLGDTGRRELAESILQESERLNRQVANLLDMTRLEEGSVEPHREWQPIDEVIGGALRRLEGPLRERHVGVHIEQDVGLVPIDGLLIQQVLINLLENAAKYSPAGTPLEISASREGERLQMVVADSGPGVKPGDEVRIFDKFYRSESARHQSGVGLGLSICRGIVALHGGTIQAENRLEGGLAIRIDLPIVGEAPEVVPED